MKNILQACKNFYSRHQIYFNVFVCFWTLFAICNSGVDSSEGLFHYRVAVQLIKHGQLGFDTIQDGVFQIAPNGRYYAGHELGNTLFMLPTALINVLIETIFSKFISVETIEKAQQFILSFQAGIYSSITATIFFTILNTNFLKSILSSFIATVCLVITTFFWTYSRNLFDGVLCCTLLTTSFFLLLKYRDSKKYYYLFGCFLCLGFGFITRLSMVLAILTSFGYLLILHRTSLSIKLKEFSISLLTLLPFIIWQCWYNNLRTGIFYKSPVQTAVYAANNSLDGNIIVGITGLLLSPGKSIFVYAPLLVLSLILFHKFYKEHRKEAIYVGALAILWLLLHARLKSWYGAAGWGPRHFISVLPILFLPLAVNLELIWHKIVLRALAILLASFGFVLGISSIISNWHFRLMYAVERGADNDKVFVWSFWNNQAVDMVTSAFGNITRTLNHTPIITLKDSYSEANEYASSTINIWANSLVYAGIPWYIVMVLVLPLVIVFIISVRNILHTCLSNTITSMQPSKSKV